MENQSFRVDVEKALSANAFTREGFVFVGWNTEFYGTGKVYADGAVVKNLSTEDKATVYLYAQWVSDESAPATYTVTFAANGGDGTMSAQTCKVETSVTLASNSFTRTGYRFTGWSQFELAEKAEISEQTVNSIEGLRLWPSDKTLAKIANVLEVEMYRLFVPQKLAMQSESIAELKHAVVKTVETLVHDTLQDWETQ